ncbi:MAG: hypothetical protein ACPGO5_04375 [Patescibacteria group bacterium]
MQTLSKNVYIILGLVLLSFVVAFVDIALYNHGFSSIRVFPVVLLFIFFITRYSELHIVYVAIMLVLYASIVLQPLFLVLIQFCTLLLVDYITKKILHRFSLIRVLSVSVVFIGISIISLNSTMFLLSLQGWYAIPFDITSLFEVGIGLLLFTVLSILVLYPILASYEAKHKIYLQQSPYDVL